MNEISETGRRPKLIYVCELSSVVTNYTDGNNFSIYPGLGPELKMHRMLITHYLFAAFWPGTPGPFMNTPESDDDTCNERTALMRPESPPVPAYDGQPPAQQTLDPGAHRVSVYLHLYFYSRICKKVLYRPLWSAFPASNR